MPLFLTELFVVVIGIVVDGAEEINDSESLTMCNVLLQRRRDRIFLRLVFSSLLGRFDQGVVDCEIGWHVSLPAYTLACVTGCVTKLASRAGNFARRFGSDGGLFH